MFESRRQEKLHIQINVMNSLKPPKRQLIEEKFIVEYENDHYDLTEFMLKHPGGVNTLVGFNHKNIEEKFRKVDHSPAARYLLNDYKLNKQFNEDVGKNFDISLEVS